jgi:hypothetical protein
MLRPTQSRRRSGERGPSRPRFSCETRSPAPNRQAHCASAYAPQLVPRTADKGGMSPPSLSECGRFVVLNSLHLDRNIFEALARWAAEREIGVQDAFQLALSNFNDQHTAALPPGGVVRVHDVASAYRPSSGMCAQKRSRGRTSNGRDQADGRVRLQRAER